MTGTLDRPLGLSLIAVSVAIPLVWIAAAALIDIYRNRKDKP